MILHTWFKALCFVKLCPDLSYYSSYEYSADANPHCMTSDSIMPSPPQIYRNLTHTSHFVFSYNDNDSPIAFCITRRPGPDALSLFKARGSSLCPIPTLYFDSNDNATTLDSSL